jgi:molybdate transport system substrate-binding protein
VRLGVRAARAGALVCGALVCGAAGAGCGSGRGDLDVSAAASLRRAFTQLAGQFPQASVRYSFAGSDALAAQIEQGVRPDVFASANTQLPESLYARGLVERPAVFAANVLVLAVPRGSRIRSLADAERPGTSVAIGSPSVPVGAYTNLLLARLPAQRRARLLANVRDREPDVTGIVGKLSEGAIDAGLLYATDVRSSGGTLRAIALPASLRPQVAYGVAVVRGAPHAAAARAFVTALLRGPGRADLLRDGFLPPPGR